MPVPDRVANAPELLAISAFYYVAFQTLQSCRNFEGARIPWLAIKAYADEVGCDPEQRQILYAVVEALDLWLLGYLQKRQDKSEGLGHGTTPSPSHGQSPAKRPRAAHGRNR